MQPAAGGRAGTRRHARAAGPSSNSITPEVIVASIKPSEDRKARIVRLFGAGGKTAHVTLRWGQSAPKAVWISNLAEERGKW